MSIEQLATQLEALYGAYGYTPYTMRKFEEYELYLRNKDFLISDRVLTFTDTDGKLMALKPDVTLSIIKNTTDQQDSLRKVFYRENVYRPDSQGFREIMQLGLECMGSVDDYCLLEVMLLAVSSLRAIGRNFVLDVSHMGLLSQLLLKYGLMGENEQLILKAISGKNAHEIRSICEKAGVPADDLADVATLSGTVQQVLPVLQRVFGDDPVLVRFVNLLNALERAGADCINVDFSVVNDMSYYNGIVFRGFVEGIPDGVLSGGQYDGLMQKMNRKDNAIGFALYPDLIKRIMADTKAQNMDAVLLYDDSSDVCAVANGMKKLTDRGLCVKAQRGEMPAGFDGPVYVVKGNEVSPVEADA